MRIRIDPILDKKMAWTSWYTSFSDAFKKRAGKIKKISVRRGWGDWPLKH